MAKQKSLRVIHSQQSSEQMMSDTESEKLLPDAPVRTRDALVPLFEEISKSKVFYRNWYFPGCKLAFPTKPHLHFVTRYYPYATPPLLVDEPTTEWDEKDCLEKARYLRQAKFRYLIFSTNMTMDEALEQLGETK